MPKKSAWLGGWQYGKEVEDRNAEARKKNKRNPVG
jgi:hypothetical protein